MIVQLSCGTKTTRTRGKLISCNILCEVKLHHACFVLGFEDQCVYASSWLYNLFTSFIEGKIKDHLKSQVNYKQLPKII